jgi:hypothetical protein
MFALRCSLNVIGQPLQLLGSRHAGCFRGFHIIFCGGTQRLEHGEVPAETQHCVRPMFDSYVLSAAKHDRAANLLFAFLAKRN